MFFFYWGIHAFGVGNEPFFLLMKSGFGHGFFPYSQYEFQSEAMAMSMITRNQIAQQK